MIYLSCLDTLQKGHYAIELGLEPQVCDFSAHKDNISGLGFRCCDCPACLVTTGGDDDIYLGTAQRQGNKSHMYTQPIREMLTLIIRIRDVSDVKHVLLVKRSQKYYNHHTYFIRSLDFIVNVITRPSTQRKLLVLCVLQADSKEFHHYR